MSRSRAGILQGPCPCAPCLVPSLLPSAFCPLPCYGPNTFSYTLTPCLTTSTLTSTTRGYQFAVRFRNECGECLHEVQRAGRSDRRLAALVVLTSAPAFAHPSTDARGALSEVEGQGGSTKTALAGTVADAAGGVIPGATVVVKNNDTGVTFNTMTNAEGAFSVPALDPGTYTVTVSLSGFKTAVIKNQRLVAASPASVKVTLEVGALHRNGRSPRRIGARSRRRAGTVSSTLMTEQLKTIPLPTRNALYAVNLLPGVDTTGTVRDSTINGLPEQTINITLDGVNVNNNQDKAGDGFYAMVRPQLDAIEQVTLTTAAQGAESAGQGAVQIRFVTRSGTNTLPRHGLRLHPAPGAQHQLLDQREEQPRQEPHHPAPGGRQPRRADLHSEALRRARQGVLLLQLRGVLPADRSDADAHDPQRRTRAGTLHVQPRSAGTAAERSTCMRASRPRTGNTASVRSDDSGGSIDRRPRGGADDRHDQRPAERAQPRDLHLPEPGQGRGTPADDARGLQPQRRGTG